MAWTTLTLKEVCRIEKGLHSAANEAPGPFPMVVTGAERKSSASFQIDGEAVCIPLVSSTGHGNAAINRVHHENGKFAVASILAAAVPKVSSVSARFLYYYFTATKERTLVPLMRGTSNVALTITSLSEARVCFPGLEEQHRIVRRLDTVAALVAERRRSIEAAERETQALLLKAFQRAIDGAPLRPMSEVAPLVRRPVEIDLEGTYPELGVRSFGKGTFHKPDLPGAEVGNKKLFRIDAGDLLFNIVFAWEGAVAVAQPEDDGRVGSHRFLSCVPAPDMATVEFLRFYFSTREGLQKLGEASPGGAGRNRTLGLKKLEDLQVPVPSIERQHWFDCLQTMAREARAIRASTAKDVDALIPAMLHDLFNATTAD